MSQTIVLELTFIEDNLLVEFKQASIRSYLLCAEYRFGQTPLPILVNVPHKALGMSRFWETNESIYVALWRILLHAQHYWLCFRCFFIYFLTVLPIYVSVDPYNYYWMTDQFRLSRP